MVVPAMTKASLILGMCLMGMERMLQAVHSVQHFFIINNKNNNNNKKTNNFFYWTRKWTFLLHILLTTYPHSTHKAHSHQMKCLASMVWLLRQRCLCRTWPVVVRNPGMWLFLVSCRTCTNLVTTQGHELGVTHGASTQTWATLRCRR